MATKKKTKKTTAAAEKAAREARMTKAPRQSKAAQAAIDAAAALARNANAAQSATSGKPSDPHAAENLAAQKLGIQLAEDEFLTAPTELPTGFKVKKIVARDGAKLPAPIYKVIAPQPTAPPAGASKSAKRAPRDVTQAKKEWTKGSVETDRAKTLLAKLQKATRSKPVMAARELSDNERAIARRLFAQGLIQRDKFEQGIGYFAAAK